MKHFNYYRVLLLFFFLYFFDSYVSADFVAVPGTRIWDLIAELGYETNTILSKVGVIESIVEHTPDCCSQIGVIDSKINVIESIVEHASSCCSQIGVIDSKTNIIESSIEHASICCSEVAIIDSKINVIESLVENTHCCSTIAVINDKLSVIESLLENTDFSSVDQAFVSIYEDQIAEKRLDNISVQFQYGIPSTTVTTYTQGGGTVTTANSTAVLSTAASATSIAQLQTTNTIGYRSGHEAYAYFTVAFTGAFASTSSQFIGPIDYQNGFAIGFDGTTFGVTRRVNTVNTFTPQSSFNGDKLNGTGASGFTYNPAFLNVFRIGYGYLGSSIIKFQIMNTDGSWITFHTIQYPNSAATPSIYQPFLPVTARVENIAGTSVLSMNTVSWNAGIVASPNTSSYRYYEVDTSVTPTSSTETHIVTIQNKLVFNNQRNVIRVRCTGFTSCKSSTSPGATFRLQKNATITSPSYSDVDTNNSVVQVTTTGTFVGGTGTAIFLNPYIAADSGPILLFIPSTYNIYLLPGETLTLTTAESTGTQVGAIMWEEQF